MSTLPYTETCHNILQSINEGVFTVDQDWHVTSFNRAAEQITGLRAEDVIGRICRDVFQASMCQEECALKHTLRTGVPVCNQPIQITNAHGERIPVSISTAALKDSEGNTIGGVETFQDLSVVEELRREVGKQ